MNPTVPEERYAEVARREITSGQPRGPVWQTALSEAGGDRINAEERYIQARVRHMTDDETKRQQAGESLQKLRRLNDSLAPSRLMKCVLLCLGLLLALVIWWVVQK